MQTEGQCSRKIRKPCTSKKKNSLTDLMVTLKYIMPARLNSLDKENRSVCSPLGLILLVRTYQNTSSFTVNIFYGTAVRRTAVRSLYERYTRRINVLTHAYNF